jgi:glycerophosphoryl diester phosphodiesterase
MREILSGFFIVAHRGASGSYPENTMLSFSKAVEFGADVVELDVRLSRDGVPIVFHDNTLDRLIGLSGKISDYDYNDIKTFRVGGEPIPSLEEALGYLVDHVGVFIEVKEDAGIQAITDIIIENGYEKNVAVISFNEGPLTYIHNTTPTVVTGYIYMKPGDGIVKAKKIGAEIVLPYYRLASSKAIAFAHRLGLKVVVWVINDTDMALEYHRRGADGIATDYPEKIIEALKSV